MSKICCVTILLSLTISLEAAALAHKAELDRLSADTHAGVRDSAALKKADSEGLRLNKDLDAAVKYTNSATKDEGERVHAEKEADSERHTKFLNEDDVYEDKGASFSQRSGIQAYNNVDFDTRNKFGKSSRTAFDDGERFNFGAAFDKERFEKEGGDGEERIAKLSKNLEIEADRDAILGASKDHEKLFSDNLNAKSQRKAEVDVGHKGHGFFGGPVGFGKRKFGRSRFFDDRDDFFGDHDGFFGKGYF